MKNVFRMILITLPIAAIGAVVLVFLVSNRPPPAQVEIAERATTVRVVAAQIHPVSPSVTGFGLVSPARSFEAIAQVAGRVEYLNPELSKGGILPKDAVLLRLSPEDFNLAIAQARANIRAAEAKLNEIAVSERNQIAAMALEQQALDLKAADLARAENLFRGGTVPQNRVDAARAAHLAQAQKVLSIESTLALLPTQRDVQVEQIAVYKASLETAKLNLARTELTLPFAARVASVSVELGQFVRAGQTAVVLDGIKTAEVEAQVAIAGLYKLLQAMDLNVAASAANPSLMTQMLRGLGLGAEVTLSLGEETVVWTAKLDRISETIDPKTGMAGLILQIDNAYAGALPGQRPPLTKGMFVKATLSAAPINGIVIPRNALRNGEVLVADQDDRLRSIPVVTKLVQGEIAVLSEGLEPGARVIVSDPSPVIPGMLLNVVEGSDLMADLAATGRVQ